MSSVDERFLALADVVNDIAREIRVRAGTSTPIVPLTPTQSQVMRYVHTHPGCSASDIADRSGMQRANVSTALRELRSRGYLVSHRDENDGQAIRIHATARADETIARLRDAWAGLLADAWGDADADPVTDAIEVLVRVRAGLVAESATKAVPSATPAAVSSVADSTTNPSR